VTVRYIESGGTTKGRQGELQFTSGWDARVDLFAYKIGGMKRPRPNQAMERTATRRAFTFPVASAPPLQATPANRWPGLCLGYWLFVICYQEESSLSPAVADLGLVRSKGA